MVVTRRPSKILVHATDLWFLMHHSEDPNRKAVVLTCYVDDSGTEEQSKVVMLGACILGRSSFIRFDKAWRTMLHRYRIESLHMADFVRPYGRYVGMHRELKVSLFEDAIKTINSRKDYSVSVAVTHSEFKKAVSTEFYRSTLAPYAAAFVALTLVNAKIANDVNYPDRVAYLVDEGSPYANQLRIGHLLVRVFENSRESTVRTGSFRFANDNDVSTLQGSDVIAWSSRRKHSGDGLRDEFSPLNKLFEERFTAAGIRIRPHVHYQVQDDLTTRIMAQLASSKDALLTEAIAGLQALMKDTLI